MSRSVSNKKKPVSQQTQPDRPFDVIDRFFNVPDLQPARNYRTSYGMMLPQFLYSLTFENKLPIFGSSDSKNLDQIYHVMYSLLYNYIKEPTLGLDKLVLYLVSRSFKDYNDVLYNSAIYDVCRARLRREKELAYDVVKYQGNVICPTCKSRDYVKVEFIQVSSLDEPVLVQPKCTRCNKNVSNINL